MCTCVENRNGVCCRLNAWEREHEDRPTKRTITIINSLTKDCRLNRPFPVLEIRPNKR